VLDTHSLLRGAKVDVNWIVSPLVNLEPELLNHLNDTLFSPAKVANRGAVVSWEMDLAEMSAARDA